MSEAKTGRTVRLHYTGRLKGGSAFDNSARRDPLEITPWPAGTLPSK